MRLRFLLLFLTFTLACQNQLTQSPEEDWGYKGERSPRHWDELDKAYTLCGEGLHQSPINLTDSTASGKHTVKFKYKKSHEDIVNNGHTIQFVYDRGSRIYFDQSVYDLLQFHFHTPSEHHVENQEFAAEMHFVHKDSLDRLLVLSVLFEVGKENAFLKKVLDDVPETEQEKESPKQIDVSQLLPRDRHFYYYEGSLTTPPCTEQVKWLIFRRHLHASVQQIDRLRELEGYNARPLQRKNDRKVEEL